MKKRIISLMMIAAFVIAAGCSRGQRPDETNEDFGKYRKAFYSAELIYSFEATGDVVEIFKDGGVLDAASARTGIEMTDQVLIGVDEFTGALEQGLPGGKIEKAREAIKRIKDAIAAGAIKFASDKARTYYETLINTAEVTLNLAEAFANRDQKRIKQLTAQRTAGIRALRDDTREPWFTAVIVRATRLATDVNGISPLDAVEIWPLARSRSKLAHDENKVRLSAWQ